MVIALTEASFYENLLMTNVHGGTFVIEPSKLTADALLNNIYFLDISAERGYIIIIKKI